MKETWDSFPARTKAFATIASSIAGNESIYFIVENCRNATVTTIKSFYYRR